MNTEESRLLASAVYIINQVAMAAGAAERHLLKTFARVELNAKTDMVRVHLPQYLLDDSEKFLREHSKYIRQRRAG